MSIKDVRAVNLETSIISQNDCVLELVRRAFVLEKIGDYINHHFANGSKDDLLTILDKFRKETADALDLMRNSAIPCQYDDDIKLIVTSFAGGAHPRARVDGLPAEVTLELAGKTLAYMPIEHCMQDIEKVKKENRSPSSYIDDILEQLEEALTAYQNLNQRVTAIEAKLP